MLAADVQDAVFLVNIIKQGSITISIEEIRISSFALHNEILTNLEIYMPI